MLTLAGLFQHSTESTLRFKSHTKCRKPVRLVQTGNPLDYLPFTARDFTAGTLWVKIDVVNVGKKGG